MNSFNKKLKDYLTFYKTPIAPDQLDPMLFYFPETGEPPRLHQGIHAHILNDMEMFCSGQPTRIKTVAIVGDAVTPGKSIKNGEVRAIIVLNKDIMDLDVDGVLAEDVLRLANSLSKRYITGTTRNIRYSVSLRDLDPAEHVGIYEIPTQKWTKLPSGLR